MQLDILVQIQLKYMAEEMQAIHKGLEKVAQELAASENDGAISEHFCQVILESWVINDLHRIRNDW